MKLPPFALTLTTQSSLSPHGESGLKFIFAVPALTMLLSLSPHGESGLKSIDLTGIVGNPLSLPAWGEWIEIIQECHIFLTCPVSPRMGRVD